MTDFNSSLTRGALFEIVNLHVSVEGREILRGLNLEVGHGEVHALMGRNGSGKSTLANALMGHPKYQITKGSVRLDGEDVLGLKPEERAKRGMFLAFQNPIAIPGVGTGHFLRAAVKAVRGTEGFSGGEKKRAEMLQLSMLKPRMAVLDEPDSGLDIDAVRIVSDSINQVHEQQPKMGILLITHYQRILNYVRPDRVHVMANGRIVESGGEELVQELESQGYDPILRRLGIEDAEEAAAHGR
jgi:Fe-S cluster assembly ATP-binding protein